MEIHMKMWACLLCLVVVGFKLCNGTRLLPENNHDLFIAPLQNPSAFDSKLNLVMVDSARSVPIPKDLAEISGVPCEVGENEMKPWNAFANNDIIHSENKLTFRFKENRTGDDAGKESEVYNVLPKGSAPPSGPSRRGNVVVNGQGLARSMHSLPLGPTPIYNKAGSRQSGGIGHMQDQSVSEKRILKSTPSKGGGH